MQGSRNPGKEKVVQTETAVFSYTSFVIQLFPSREIAVLIGTLPVHWYGVMYALGFLIGIRLLPGLLSRVGLILSSAEQELFVLLTFLGVLLGGRLGFVLFYGGSYYISHPSKIFAVWEGGMSSHGGFIGVSLAIAFFAWRYRIDLLRLTDAIVVPVAIGLALGRIGNFINGELYGTVTTVPWAMKFPEAEGLRHPTQIYAVLKDSVIAALCFLHLARGRAKVARSGQTTALFLILYSVFRFFVEIFRDQPYGFTPFLGISLSRGQLLTLPILLLGVGILIVRRK